LVILYNIYIMKTNLLFGLELMDKKIYDKIKNNNNNPLSTCNKHKKDKTVKIPIEKIKTYDPNHEYSLGDLDFLKKEKLRIDNILLDTNISDEVYELNLDLQDNLADLIGDLEEICEKNPKSEEIDDTDSEINDSLSETSSSVKTIEETGIIEKKNKSKVTHHQDKVRYEKGSIKALEVGKNLIEARKRARELKGLSLTVKEKADIKRLEKVKIRQEKLKPWYYIGIIPKGYREATEDEAIKNDMVSEFGKYKVDQSKYRFYKLTGVLQAENITKSSFIAIYKGNQRNRMETKKEIEILINKIDNGKYDDHEKDNYKNKLEHYEKKYDALLFIYEFLLKNINAYKT